MDQLDIKGYKSIRDLSLELHPVNILIGSNGSGKSNLLSFFDFLKSMYAGGLREYVALRGGVDRFLFEGSKVSSEITAHLHFGKNGYSFCLKPGEGEFIFTEEGLWYPNPYYDNPYEIASLTDRSKLPEITLPRARYIQKYLGQLEQYHFHDTSRNSPFTRMSNVETDVFRLYDQGENIAAYLYGIKQRDVKAYQRIIGTIQGIAPYFRDFVLRPNDKGDLSLLWNDRFSSMVYGINDMSDGTKRFVALTTLFLQPDLPQTIIIDEPELGLHPAAITKLAGMVKMAAKRGTQVILATQSTDLINHFDAEDVVTVSQHHGESRFDRHHSEELAAWLEDYSLGELWQKNIIGGRP